MPIESQIVEIDDDVTGWRWSVDDKEYLAKLIAIITLGQASHAARIIQELEPYSTIVSHTQLFAGARGQLVLRGATEKEKNAHRFHRDGFLFECISWIVARREGNDRTYLKDPHISATTQGLDGLIIELETNEAVIKQATICEDKCTKSPRTKFKTEVLSTFAEHHSGDKRSRELLASTIALISASGLDGTAATRAAAAVFDKNLRVYRAALTATDAHDNVTKRKALFKGYSALDEITKAQRIGATFIVEGDLRLWFQELADLSIEELNKLEADDV